MITRVSRHVALLAFFCFLLLATNSAQSPADRQPQIPEPVIYHMYFSHVAAVIRIATKLESEGKSEDDLRDHDRLAAGLSEEEGDIVEEVALDCVQALNDRSARIRAELAARGIQPSNRLTTIRSTAAAIRPSETIEEVVNDHVARLKETLDEESFAKLDRYVRSLLLAHRETNKVQTPQSEIPPNEPVKRGLNKEETGGVQ